MLKFIGDALSTIPNIYELNIDFSKVKFFEMETDFEIVGIDELTEAYKNLPMNSTSTFVMDIPDINRSLWLYITVYGVIVPY